MRRDKLPQIDSTRRRKYRLIMKPILYAFVFAFVVLIGGFVFFAVSEPAVSQRVVSKALDARDVFAPAISPAAGR